MDQPHPSPDSFGALLNSFRKRRYLTQQHLATALGVGRNTIGRWERGDFLPESKGMVLELARQLRLDDQEARHFLEASLTALAPYWLVPLPRNPFFTGREEILEALHAQLGVEYAGDHLSSIALQGLGGVGKTQIVLEYTYRHALEYSAVFWIGAETSEQIISSLLRIAEVLQLPERHATEQQRIVAAVQRWLATHSHWLLIWDNLEDLELWPRFLPPARHGANLITTRRQALGSLARGIQLGPMLREEGLLFVLRRAKVLEGAAGSQDVQRFTGASPSESAAAELLAEAMDGLPLALDQAGAYIEETRCRLADYLQYYEQQRARWLDRRGPFGSDHPHSVTTTFSLLWQRVQRDHPAAADLLGLCAFLHAEAIPEELFWADGSLQAEPGRDATQFDQAIASLRAFSLVQRQPATRTFSFHRLIQVVLQAKMSEQEQSELQRRAMCLLHAIFPEISPETQVEIWEQCERLLPHVLACAASIPEQLQDQDLAETLLKAARYLFQRSQYAQGTLLCQRALRLFERTLGPEHLQVALSLHSLAALHREQGQYEQAAHLYQRALQIREQALGLEHPDVAASLNNLAFIYRELGEYMQAEPLYLRALRLREQALGPEHPNVAFSLSELAILYRERGMGEQAEPLYQRSVCILEQALGPDHPDVARPLNNLADLYREQGRYEQSEPLALRAVHVFERALGPEHPSLAIALDTLADLYREQGRYQEAQPLYQRVLRICEQALSPSHPFVAYPLEGLATLLREQGHFEEAEALYQRALSIREQRLGPHHPETAQSLHELAILQEQQGNLNEARALAERALSICSQSLGEAHPKTRATRDLYARLLQASAAASPGKRAEESARAHQDECKTELSVERIPLALQEAGDQVHAFLYACCELDPRAGCRVSDLWQAYEHWSATEQRCIPLSRRAFAAHLKAQGCRADRTNAARLWRGVRLVQRSP